MFLGYEIQGSKYMEIVKILGVAFVTAIAAILIKQTKPEISFSVIAVGGIIILLLLVDNIKTTISVIQILANETGLENELLKVLFKIIGIGYLCEFGSGVLTDFGSTSLADKVALGGKILIVILSLPIVEHLLGLIKGFVALI